MENYYTTKQTARILHVSIVKVYEFIKIGKLKAYKLGGNGNSKKHWRIAEKDLEHFIKGGTTQALPTASERKLNNAINSGKQVEPAVQ